MERAFILCLVIFVLVMPSVVKAESNTDPQQDQYNKQLRDKQQQDRQEQEQQGRDKQLRDKQQRDRREQNQQGRDKQLRDKQQRDRQEQEQQERDKQLRDKQQRDRREQDQQGRDQELRDKQQRDRQGRNQQRRDQDKPQRDNWQQDSRHNWSHPAYHHKNWQRTDHRSDGRMPLNWHQKIDRYSPDYQMEPIHIREWNNRFPGLHLFQWMDRRGEGFWYRNQRIVDAIMFYNEADELVSIGFIHDGIFIMIRDDDQCYENHDSFFLSWWNHKD